MTHDELLHKLDNAPCSTDNEHELNLYVTLRAVVELTRPMKTYGTATLAGYNEAMSVIFQAIEKELK